MKKTLQFFNVIALASTLFINYLSNTGIINGKTIGSVSNNIKSLFTPAGYAFSIWAAIYLLLLGFSIFQARSLFTKVKDDDFVEKIGLWFIFSCLANSFWIFSWIYGYTGVSCIFIFLLLISLLKIIVNLDINLNKVSSFKYTFLYLPFIIYSGWVSVASIANVSSYLTKLNWTGFGFSDEIWTIIMILIATNINLFITLKRKMYAFAYVGSWALIAIGIANKNTHQIITNTAYLAALLLILISLFKQIKPVKYQT